MIIYEGIIKEIVDPDKREVICTSIEYGHDIFCNVVFTNNDLSVNDSVLILVLSPKTLSRGYAIPLPAYVDQQSLNNIRIFYKKNEIYVDREKIQLILDKKEEQASIYIDKDKIEIKKKDKALVKMENEYIEINTKQLYTPGMPKVNQSESKGGFSQILFCPFTGLPHNTDTLEQNI